MKKRREMTVWYGKIEDAPKYPDVPYWQAQTDEVKFAAAWEMVVDAYAMKGVDESELSFQRSVGGLQKRGR